MKLRGMETGSMDMLLDTMCNTFGGVCFIALMVVLISQAIPKESDAKDELDRVTQAEIASKEMARLVQRRDMLKTAIELETAFVNSNENAVVTRADVAKLLSEVAVSGDKIAEYEKKRIEYLDELAKLKTKEEYSRREAARLDRLLGELRKKTADPLSGRHRVVRAPQERELKGMRPIDVWLYHRRLYLMANPDQVRTDPPVVENGEMLWAKHIMPGRGMVLDDEFFSEGAVWPELKRKFGAGTIVRIFVDSISFDELCLLRDALIANDSFYNWHVHEGDTITFVRGYDGRVQ